MSNSYMELKTPIYPLNATLETLRGKKRDAAIVAFGTRVMEYVGLHHGWQIQVKKTPRTRSALGSYGTTDPRNRLIIINQYWARRIGRFYDEEIYRTVLHEIAHAMEPFDGHGKRWRNTYDYLLSLFT